MRRALTVLCVVALMGFVANTALATTYNRICLDNLNNTSGSTTATTNGLLWLDTGSGPQKLTADVNIELLGGITTTPTLDCFQTANSDVAKLLLSTGTATGDVTFMATPGLFLDCGPDAGTSYAVPGSAGVVNHCYFQVLAWTGNYSSYDAAKAAGAYVGKSTVFENPAASVGTSELDNMPAVILAKAVPEPSTVLLMAAGLLGLLAHAWRKRK